MGLPSDAEELMGKALRDVAAQKRSKIVWALVASFGSIIGSTATVSWQMGHYIAKAEAKDNELRESLLVLDKKIDDLGHAAAKAKEELQAGIYDARAAADTALLYAQLTGKGRP